MKKAELKEGVLKMRFEDVYDRFQKSKLTTEEASDLLGICSRTFLRLRMRYEEEGFEGLYDRRLGQPSPQISSNPYSESHCFKKYS